MQNKQILILGSTGQIGKELSLKLLKYKNIKTVCHSRTKVASSFQNKNNIISVIGKIDSRDVISELKNSDLIFDLAAPDRGTLDEIKEFYKNRFEFIIPLLKKNCNFVFASSMNAFGIDDNRKVLKNYFLSSSIYCSNKRFAEKYLNKLSNKFNINIYTIRLSEVHGDLQRASHNIIRLIENKYFFEIYNYPAWVTFISSIEEVIINILRNKEKPGMYTLVCDDIYWPDLLKYYGNKISIQPKYELIEHKLSFVQKLKNHFNYIINKYKDTIRGNINLKDELQDEKVLNYRINKTKNMFSSYKLKKKYVTNNCSKYIGILPGERFKSISLNKEISKKF